MMTVAVARIDAKNVVVTGEKQHAAITVWPHGVMVLVKPSSQRLFGTLKSFPTFDDALASYKSVEAKAMIQAAKDEFQS